MHDGGLREVYETTRRGMRDRWGRCATVGWRSWGEGVPPLLVFLRFLSFVEAPPSLANTFLSPSSFEYPPLHLLTPSPSLANALPFACVCLPLQFLTHLQICCEGEALHRLGEDSSASPPLRICRPTPSQGAALWLVSRCRALARFRRGGSQVAELRRSRHNCRR